MALLVFISAFELWHRLAAGHFVSYGTHTHLLKEPQDIGIPGIKTGYAVDAFNYGFIPITIKGCKEASDISPYYQIVYRYQVEKWDSNGQAWKRIISLNPADCPADRLVNSTLWPGQSLRIVDWEATAAREGFQIGDSARFVAYALFDSADNASRQTTFVTHPFLIEEQATDNLNQYRIKH